MKMMDHWFNMNSVYKEKNNHDIKIIKMIILSDYNPKNQHSK